MPAGRGNALLGAALLLVATLLAFQLLAAPASALEIEREGLVFSDELGGMRLLSVTGSGRKSDPFVVTEEIFGDGPAILTIRRTGAQAPQSGPIGLFDSFSLFMVKVVINASGRDWGAFDIELREEPSTPSDYRDGLSFGQMYGKERKIESDRFEGWRQLDEPIDRITFFGGEIRQGEAGRFGFLITDPTPAARFYLLQEPRLVLAQAPGRQAIHLATGPR